MDSSLLSGVDWSKPVHRKYDIGMNEYVGDKSESTANSIKKGKENALSLSLKKSRTSSAPPPKRPRTTLQPISGNETAPSRFDFSKEDRYGEMSVPFIPSGPTTTFKRGLRIEIADNQCPKDLRAISESCVSLEWVQR